MNRVKRVFVLTLTLSLLLFACGGDKPAGKTAEQAASPQVDQSRVQKSERVAAKTPASFAWNKIGDIAEAWNDLYNKNEAVINAYEGMPIMGLVSPQLSFALSVQYDIMNPGNQDGEYEGKLMLAGYNGFTKRSGSMITFGYADTLEKDRFGPGAKAGDNVSQNGFLDLAKAYYRSEVVNERSGRKISRSFTEFKRMADGSMICIDFQADAFDFRGNESMSNQVIYLHNGAGRYDFIVAKGTAGVDFKAISFADEGDLTKAQALELIKAAGYTVEKSGGIKDGKLVLDPK